MPRGWSRFASINLAPEERNRPDGFGLSTMTTKRTQHFVPPANPPFFKRDRIKSSIAVEKRNWSQAALTAQPRRAMQWSPCKFRLSFCGSSREVAIGDRIDGWRVYWIGGWDKRRGLFVVMVERPLPAKRQLELENQRAIESSGVAGLLFIDLTKRQSGVVNWLSMRQAQALLKAPDARIRGLLTAAILAILLGCGSRRSEVAALTLGHILQRDNRWCIIDLVGKHGRKRVSRDTSPL
jgi:integrase